MQRPVLIRWDSPFGGRLVAGSIVAILCAGFIGTAAPSAPPLNSAARQYLGLIENFAGFAERHWNEKDGSYDAAGSGVTWARGNGGVCLAMAVLLTEFPDRTEFFPQKVSRADLIEHVRRAIRSVCLAGGSCTDPRAVKPSKWGGLDLKNGGNHWQGGLETEHWALAAHLLASDLDADTIALARQVATSEADAAMRPIPSAQRGNTAADDCAWNAGVLGVCAAIYGDDPRAAKWDEWAKRWALNMEARESDRASNRIIDGKPLREWIVSTNVFPDFTLENHGFWDLPYQTGFAALAEPIVAYYLCGRPIPEAFHANAREQGDHIFKWLVLPDGDLLCPQGIDWAERDVQHSWAFTILGTLEDQAWARAADARCLRLLTHRQARFGDGSIHALDFGYETDLAVVWTFSFLLHKYFGRGDSGLAFDEPRGAKIYRHVAAAVFRTPDLVSSVTWFRSRQAVMVSPNNLELLADRPAFTRYDSASGTGWILFNGDRKRRAFRVVGEPRIRQESAALAVSYGREISGLARQEIDYVALPTGEVIVFSRWRTLRDVQVMELVDHPFRWVEIDRFIAKPEVTAAGGGVWSIDGKLRMQILGGASGEQVKDGINGVVRRDFAAKGGEVLLESVGIYQAETRERKPRPAVGDGQRATVGDWIVEREQSGGIKIGKSGTGSR